MATLEDLEARVAVLEAQQADYQAVLTTINALAVQTREQFDRVDRRLDEHTARFDRVDRRLDEHTARFDRVDRRLDEHTARFNSIDEHMAELKDLMIQILDRPSS